MGRKFSTFNELWDAVQVSCESEDYNRISQVRLALPDVGLSQIFFEIVHIQPNGMVVRDYQDTICTELDDGFVKLTDADHHGMRLVMLSSICLPTAEFFTDGEMFEIDFIQEAEDRLRSQAQ